MTKTIVTLSNVTKKFSTAGNVITAVDNVSLDVSQGEIFGIIGYSGAGKSTLIRLLNGLEAPTTGSVMINGLDISVACPETLRQARLKIGMIFQHFNLLWSRTVRQNIAFALQIAGADAATIRQRVAELIRLVGLEGREQAYPSQLSGGQKQRVGIARALANQPDLLLCDEATSALDPQTTESILDLLVDINSRLGLTIVMVTHEMHVVRRICHRVAVMDNGRIVESGRTAAVFTHPREAITQRFVRQFSAETDRIEFDPRSIGLEGGALLHLVYSGAHAGQPILAQAMEKFGIPFNILHGQLNHFHNEVFGELHIHIPTDTGRLNEFIDWVGDHGITAEIIEAH